MKANDSFTKKNDLEVANKTALMRFAMIAPIIQGTFPDASASAYCRRVSETPVRRPDGSEFHYAPKTIERWAAQYRVNGLDALMPKVRNDKGKVRVLSDECIAAIHRIKGEYPKLGGNMVHQRLLAEGLIDSHVSVRTVQRYLKANGLKKTGPTGIQKARLAFEESYFGAMWEADTCFFPYIEENGRKRRTYLIAIVDDFSRLVVGAKLFYEENAINFQKVYKQAAATFGIPMKLYVDNGKPYSNSQLAKICAQIGTVLIHAPIKDGAAKGKVERTFGTFKTRWLYGLKTSALTGIAEFNDELAAYVRSHNTTVNSSTQATPMDRFMATRSHIRSAQSNEWLDECFMHRVIRKVRNDSTLSVLNTSFDAPQQFIGQSVEVRYLPDDLENAYVLERGCAYPLKLTDKAANAHVKRSNLTIDYAWKDGGVNV